MTDFSAKALILAAALALPSPAFAADAADCRYIGDEILKFEEFWVKTGDPSSMTASATLMLVSKKLCGLSEEDAKAIIAKFEAARALVVARQSRH